MLNRKLQQRAILVFIRAFLQLHHAMLSFRKRIRASLHNVLCFSRAWNHVWRQIANKLDKSTTVEGSFCSMLPACLQQALQGSQYCRLRWTETVKTCKAFPPFVTHWFWARSGTLRFSKHSQLWLPTSEWLRRKYWLGHHLKPWWKGKSVKKNIVAMNRWWLYTTANLANSMRFP